jgi:methylmalonyl-CoA mutase cobalamin-binding subunit
LYSPSQSNDADEDRMEFVVEEEAEEDDGTHVEETPQVHSANEVAARAQELDVQAVVPSTAAENTPTQIPKFLEA